MIRLRGIKDECFQDYRKVCMLLITCFCDWKCWDGEGDNICQNCGIINDPIMEFSNDYIINRYLSNPLTHALVIGGLEPLLQKNELLDLIVEFRKVCNDDIVIYTGYYICEIDSEFLNALSQYENIFLKCGRFIPNGTSRYDDVLGITLSSDNQYGVELKQPVITINVEENV